MVNQLSLNKIIKEAILANRPTSIEESEGLLKFLTLIDRVNIYTILTTKSNMGVTGFIEESSVNQTVALNILTTISIYLGDNEQVLNYVKKAMKGIRKVAHEFEQLKTVLPDTDETSSEFYVGLMALKLAIHNITNDNQLLKIILLQKEKGNTNE